MIFVTILLSMFIIKFYKKWRDKHDTKQLLGVLNVEASNELSNNEQADNRLEMCNFFILSHCTILDCLILITVHQMKT